MTPNTAKLHLTIQSSEGSYTDDFNEHNTVEQVVKETVKHLHLHDDPANPFILEYNGQELPLQPTLAHDHIPDNATLTLRTKTSGGG
ncbi:MAG TPA: hypothetical protein VF157_12240 [Chloroflexota bacterium]